ncbi:hypothetical protein GCM10009850_048930 [Nonomuraea monospora]|uniref:Uncharacterized protein n=1 Tax=Nonomuraea monospora TaxID=568818 RepID=A0ABP5PFN3_9ACTN
MKNPRTLITTELFDKLAGRVAKDEGIDLTLAERIMEQTLVFLVACGQNSGAKLAPSNATDPGWHAFILHTKAYADFCQQVAGRFIHHLPIMNEDIRSGNALTRTLDALGRTGYRVDHDLWQRTPTCMNTCNHPCHDSDDDSGDGDDEK